MMTAHERTKCLKTKVAGLLSAVFCKDARYPIALRQRGLLGDHPAYLETLNKVFIRHKRDVRLYAFSASALDCTCLDDVIVVNSIKKDTIVGYLSTPKDTAVKRF
jgi:hypothetical protein